MGYRAILMFTLTLILAWSSQAFAQDKTGASVVVLKFNTTGVEQELTDLFFLELHEQIRAHQEMHVAGSGEVTIQDLMLMAGCSEPTADCMKGLSDFIEGDRVVFGSISKANEAYNFNVSMFDFKQGRYMRELKDFSLTGNVRDVQAQLPVVAEALFYGNVGVLEVSVEGTGAARVFVNDVDKGRTPLSLSELPLGEVTVTVWGDDESEHSETVILRHDQPAEVVFAIDAPTVVASGKSSSSTPYMVSGIALASIGVAGLVTAAIGHMDLEQLNNQASSMLASGQTAINSSQASKTQDLQADMNTAQTMRVVGISAGAVGIVAGSILLVKAFTSGGSDDVAPPVADSSTIRNLRVAPSTSGIGFSLGGNF